MYNQITIKNISKYVNRSLIYAKKENQKKLIDWKNTPNHSPLIIKGCRQCGKTYSVRDFAKKYYKHEIYLNFFKNTNYLSIFDGLLEINNLIMLICTNIKNLFTI